MNITNPQQDIEKVLFSEEQIRSRVRELGKELTAQYRDKTPVVVCILKGAAFFYTDLCRELKCHIDTDFISVSSYGASTKSSGVVRLVKDFDNDINGRHVLIVEDIIDSGLTLKYLRKLLASRNPASIKTVCLLDKADCHAADCGTDYCGFKIPNAFVVGYGLDIANRYRNLPYIGILKPSVYQD